MEARLEDEVVWAVHPPPPSDHGSHDWLLPPELLPCLPPPPDHGSRDWPRGVPSFVSKGEVQEVAQLMILPLLITTLQLITDS